MCNITDIEATIENGNLYANFKVNGKEKKLIVSPFHAGVLYLKKLTLLEYTKHLIGIEYV